MYCPKCGQENTTESRYCSNCGKALSDVTVSPAEQSTTATAVQPHEVSVKKKTSPMAITSLVLGIIGVIFNVMGILAIIFGAIALSQIGRDKELGGRNLAIAGLVLGIIVVLFWVIILVFLGTLRAFFS